MGIMEKTMETSIVGYLGFSSLGFVGLVFRV